MHRLRPPLVTKRYQGINWLNGTFRNAADSAGNAGDHWSVSACFTDYDRDGDLDLFVAHYGVFKSGLRCLLQNSVQEYCGPQMFEATTDTLYRNDGGGHFTDVTEAAGINKGSRSWRRWISSNVSGDAG